VDIESHQQNIIQPVESFAQNRPCLANLAGFYREQNCSGEVDIQKNG
jgi:hypothetical protein